MNKNLIINNTLITTYSIDDIIKIIDRHIHNKTEIPLMITYLNAYVLYKADKDIKLRNIINSAGIVTIDGISIIYYIFLHYRKLYNRCVMTDVFDSFLTKTTITNAKGIFFGAKKHDNKEAVKKINKFQNHLIIIKSYDGYRAMDEYISILKNNLDIDFILIGMGTPKSEYLCESAKKICKKAVIWHIGGGTVMCYAGEKNRAPKIFRLLGIEWLHRFINEKHTRKRYIISNSFFIYLFIKDLFKIIYEFLTHRIH